MKKVHKGFGVLAAAFAVALAGCQTMPESGPVSTEASTQSEQSAPAAPAAAKATPAAKETGPMGVAALAGQWAGTWNGAGKSTLTVGGDSADTMSVRYCYNGSCNNVPGATFTDGKLRWSNEGWHFEFVLKGDKVRGKLRNPRGTIRISMKRM